MKLHRTLFTAWVFAAGVALHAQNAHNMVVQTNKLGAEKAQEEYRPQFRP